LVAFRYLVLFGEFGAGVTRDEFFPALFGGGAVLGRDLICIGYHVLRQSCIDRLR
jgi:hypothetical protein